MDNINVVAVIPARNEEENIGKLLSDLEEQSLKPVKVFITDDGSTDKTAEICESFPFVVLSRRVDRGYDAVGTTEIAKVFNESLRKINEFSKSNKTDYVLFLGADLNLPRNYIEFLISRMEEDHQLVLTSGALKGPGGFEAAKNYVHGAGRICKFSFWMDLGGLFPEKVGWESYPVFKAQSKGLKLKLFKELIFESIRPTGGRTDYFAYGQAMRAYGYFWVLAWGRTIKHIWFRSPKAAVNMIKGYYSKSTDLYDDELRKFINKSQKQRIRKILKV